MEYKRFIHLMDDPGDIGPDTVASLQDLIKEFPYFQSAHLLLARSMKEQEHIRYERQLKLAAAYAPDRAVLFSLIHDQKKKAKSLEPIPTAVEPSPFILQEEVEEIKNEKSLDKPEEGQNPFKESSIPIQEIIVQNETKNEVPSFEEEQAYEPRYAADIEETASTEIPVTKDSTTKSQAPVSSDPREILKRRLAEILGNPDTEKQTTLSSEKNTPSQHEAIIEDTSFQKTVAAVQEPVNVEIEKVSEFTSEAIPETLSNIPEQTIQEPEATDSLAKLLPDDASKPLDNLEKLGIESALEESVLSSLENLPLMEVEEDDSEKLSLTDIGSLSVKEIAAEKPDFPETDKTQHSFTHWLHKFSGATFGKIEEVHAYDDPVTGSAQIAEAELLKLKKEEKTGFSGEKKVLIDKFIATEPKIIPSKVEFYSPVTQAKRSVEEYDDVVSETLAGIYRQQGNHLKARFCYEKLSLFYPEKRTYFAALIKEIDEELNRSNQEDL